MTAQMDVLWCEGDVAAWSDLADRLFEMIGSLAPYNQLVALYSIAQSASWLGRSDLAERALARADRMPEARDFTALHVHGSAVRAMHAYTTGRLETARAHIRDAALGAEGTVSQMALALVAPLVAVELDDETLVGPSMLTEIAGARRRADNPDDAVILAAGAAWSAAHARRDEARPDLRRALACLPRAMPSCGDVLVLSAQHLDQAELEPLRRLIDPDCFLPDDPVGRSHARLAGAILEQRFGDAERAATMALQAAAGYRQLGWWLYEARAMEAAGDLAAARALFAACGAVAQTRRLAPTPDAVAAVTHRLSGREAAIARLIAEGSGNPAIAEQLSISVKTVEKHVASIFEKLGVKSRAQVAAIVAREGRENLER
jgi:ATP/maltotriose-dependent transcriptional regulator MalT